MNDRIKELHDKAFDGIDILEGGWFLKHNKKFAELLVAECAKVCLSQRDPANLNYKPSERFAEAVKQHFGVE